MGRAHNLHAESNFPLKGYYIGKYMIIKRDGQWIAMDGEVVVKSHRDESFITNWAHKQR